MHKSLIVIVHVQYMFLLSPSRKQTLLQYHPHPDKAFVSCANAPLNIDTQRSLGLLRRNGANLRRVVFTGHVTDERAY